MAKDKFNKQQQAALDNPYNIDLIISAGAGSGKTKTLSEKVMRLIEEGMKPSELLVLTFTNNAAHEMKERIIDKFKNDENIAYQLASAHIQTFDSFSQYLVSQYSSYLKIPEQIHIVSKDVIETKKNAIIDELFEEYYADSSLNKRLLSTLKKFNLRDDNNSKQVVLSLLNEIEKLSPKDQDKFLNHYEETFLTKEAFDKSLDALVDIAKGIIKDTIYYAYFNDVHKDDLIGINSLNKIFTNKNCFTFDINNISFSDDTYVNPLYKEYISLLNLDSKTFIKKVKSFKEDNEQYFSKKKVPGLKELRNIVDTQTASLKFILDLEDLDHEYEKIIYFKGDISLYLDMVKEVISRLNTYKRTTNSYVFADISNMALSLLTDPKYESVAEEIRSHFKFIMVDEYQDTNDLQEEFINSLLKENKKGERSHLFSVGDAKQSIYGFRNSNVQLFKNRQKLYEVTFGSKSIPMNLNYRSGKPLLDDINHIFDFYMTTTHGGIPYYQRSEKLLYDNEVNLYKEPYDDFGLHRITSTSSINNDGYPYGKEEWEARAIAHDIKDKIENRYKVSVRTKAGNLIRPCTYSDFAILVRKKKGVDLYQRVFQEYNIPLNCSINDDLNNIDAIIVLQSLIELLKIRWDEERPISAEYRHTFASIARSYLYEYDDQKLFDLLYDPKEEYFLLNNDEIVLKMDEFINNHQHSSLSQIFLDLIEEYGVISKLYKIGNVDDVINKIESLYQMISTQEKAGEGIDDFIRLMMDTKKYDLDLSSESTYQVKDAVDLMTIHASKGLERKIVYMPYSYNDLGSMSNLNKPDYTFSKEYGISLPYYNYSFKNNPIEDLDSFNIKNINDYLIKASNKEEQDDIDEHVRLFYVALTRAENSLYIVGDLKKLDESYINSERNNETLYGMLSYGPHYPLLNDEYLQKLIKLGAVNKNLYQTYLEHVDIIKNIKRDFNDSDLDIETYRRYNYLWINKYLSTSVELTFSLSQEIEKEIFSYYCNILKPINNLDELASILGRWYYHDNNIHNVQDLLNVKANTTQTVKLNINKDNIEDTLNKFKELIISGNNLDTFLKLSKDAQSHIYDYQKFGSIPVGLAPIFLTVLAKHFDNVNQIKRLSFTTEEYKDKVFTFDYHDTSYLTNNRRSLPSDNIIINDEDIIFNERIHVKASKGLIDEELPNQELLDYGTYMHRLMEIVNIKTKDTSFIKNKKDKAIIDKALSLYIFNNLDNARVYQEYGYYDEEALSNGYIDLLIENEGEYYIIDYKLKHVVDEGYTKQLHTYQRNVMNIFNVSKDKTHLYLLSLIDNKLFEIK